VRVEIPMTRKSSDSKRNEVTVNYARTLDFLEYHFHPDRKILEAAYVHRHVTTSLRGRLYILVECYCITERGAGRISKIANTATAA
jgi:hypothetical protein